MKAGLHLVASLWIALLPAAVQAERADSEQPVSIEANRGSIDNRNNVHVFEGNVVLSQGSGFPPSTCTTKCPASPSLISASPSERP